MYVQFCEPLVLLKASKLYLPTTMISSSKLYPLLFSGAKSIFHLNLPLELPNKSYKTLLSIARMSGSSWACSKCTFINPQSQKARCEICQSTKQNPLSSSSSAAVPSSSLDTKWGCSSCTFLNPYTNTVCEICGTRASASLLSMLELDDDELRGTRLDFLPLKSFYSNIKEGGVTSDVGSIYTGRYGESTDVVLPLPRDVEEDSVDKKCQFVGNGESEERDSWGRKGFAQALRPCSNKRKEREDAGMDLDEVGGPAGFVTVHKAAEARSSGGFHLSPCSKVWKIMSYNVWFREDLEMYDRMKALGYLIELHSPDVICFQEVTPSFYGIFQQSAWWKQYSCSIPDISVIPGAYFCMQLSKLPVKSYSSKPFLNSIMGRELITAEVELLPDMSIVVATSHLESPCPGPPKWDQMFSKERVVQANETITFLGNHHNVIFCGDMNWSDDLDGPFPLPHGWIDAWTELRPGEPGFTYDTKSNKMLSGNRSLQKRLDRFVCKLKDFKISGIEMIGKDEIPGLSYIKEKKVKGEVKKLELPVLPSDHYGLILTLCPFASDK